MGNWWSVNSFNKDNWAAAWIKPAEKPVDENANTSYALKPGVIAQGGMHGPAVTPVDNNFFVSEPKHFKPTGEMFQTATSGIPPFVASAPMNSNGSRNVKQNFDMGAGYKGETLISWVA